MSTRLKSVCLAGMILAFATIILPLCTQESGHAQSRRFTRRRSLASVAYTPSAAT